MNALQDDNKVIKLSLGITDGYSYVEESLEERVFGRDLYIDEVKSRLVDIAASAQEDQAIQKLIATCRMAVSIIEEMFCMEDRGILKKDAIVENAWHDIECELSFQDSNDVLASNMKAMLKTVNLDNISKSKAWQLGLALPKLRQLKNQCLLSLHNRQEAWVWLCLNKFSTIIECTENETMDRVIRHQLLWSLSEIRRKGALQYKALEV